LDDNRNREAVVPNDEDALCILAVALAVAVAAALSILMDCSFVQKYSVIVVVAGTVLYLVLFSLPMMIILSIYSYCTSTSAHRTVD